MNPSPEEHEFEAEVQQLLDLMIHSLRMEQDDRSPTLSHLASSRPSGSQWSPPQSTESPLIGPCCGRAAQPTGAAPRRADWRDARRPIGGFYLEPDAEPPVGVRVEATRSGSPRPEVRRTWAGATRSGRSGASSLARLSSW